MFDWVDKILDRLHVLHAKKNEHLAAVLGFLLGGLGLGIYFRSFIDFVVPVATFVVLTYVSKTVESIATDYGLLAGAVFAALYGYLRARNSNGRLDADTAAVPDAAEPANLGQTPHSP